MKRTVWILMVVILVGGLRLLWDQFRAAPLAPADRGPAGIDFVIPPDYRILELGEARVDTAAARLLDAAGNGEKVGAVFTRSGDRIQLLVDVPGNLIDERIMSRQGTVHRVLWPGPVRERLAWARDHNDLDAPGLPAPDRRNPYH